ncbi:MAG: heparinase II/III family protein [Planctomycetota bacterium]|jgi:hypothetical protein|nr:heparinase II/III family protein [Planctomycetota bacterium]MDP7129681.1 heparinase II/III family protein [Planctomycetota bacterium]MDP7248991.1 heparinase II/III family protein [Planctomycetota bacterium]
MSYQSVFLPEHLVSRARTREEPWASETREAIVEQSEPWLAMSEQDLWELVYTPDMPRAWQVWSSGHCPKCEGDLPEYSWKIDGLKRPWKVQCPHCQQIYPTNDFEAYYRSGLASGEFDPGSADRSLLFNSEHPNPEDELHKWGVDDGWGFVQGEKCWRFIAAYLIYGQWKQLIVNGASSLADAFIVTGDADYARRAAIILDRVADIYPRMDYAVQAYVYEKKECRGYTSVWHDACEETRSMVLAYDAIRPGLQDNEGLVDFLSKQARTFGLDAKDSIEAIQENIEHGLLHHPTENSERIQTNFPRQLTLLTIIDAVLHWPERRDSVIDRVADIIEQSTSIDGTTGEKGLPAYSAYAVNGLAGFIERFARIESDLLPQLLERCPNLHKTWRFHIDTWCLQKYYPSCGDGGNFVTPFKNYVGVQFPARGQRDVRRATSVLGSSPYSFVWRLFQATGDEAYAQVMYLGNGRSTDGLPNDLFGEPSDKLGPALEKVIDKSGDTLKLGSVNKQEWHVAILRSGEGENARAAWLDYDSGRSHSHFDALNAGLFAYGLDLLPDYGYPPTGYGGHGTPEAMWYVRTAAHNTVVVNQRDQDGKQWGSNGIRAGHTTLWAEDAICHAIRVDAQEVYEECSRYERTLLMVDVSDELFYLFDVFRVVGGHDHAKFTQSHYGTVTTQGLNLSASDDEAFSEHCKLRDFQFDPEPESPWSVEWEVDDRLGLLNEGQDIRFRYTDLSSEVQAGICESWITTGNYNLRSEDWIPVAIARRTNSDSEDSLVSTFVDVMQAHEGAPVITRVRRHPITDEAGNAVSDSQVCVECELSDGRKDIVIAVDPELSEGGPMRVEPFDITVSGELMLVRLSSEGEVEHTSILG